MTVLAATLLALTPMVDGSPDYQNLPIRWATPAPSPVVIIDNEYVPWALDLPIWEALAQCESGGDWHINTGNGFYGGTQTWPGTWRAYGGLEYAPRPDLASIAEQITVNRRILDGQGWNAWPGCSRKLGWR